MNAELRALMAWVTGAVLAVVTVLVVPAVGRKASHEDRILAASEGHHSVQVNLPVAAEESETEDGETDDEDGLDGDEDMWLRSPVLGWSERPPSLILTCAHGACLLRGRDRGAPPTPPPEA